MDESLTDERRAELNARAIERLRRQAAEFERSEEIHRYGEKGQVQMTSPQQREWFNEALRDLQRAGENIPDSMIRRPITRKWRAVKSAPLEDWIDGSALLSDIKRALALVDPRPE
jgi:hypothetical protein